MIFRRGVSRALLADAAIRWMLGAIEGRGRRVSIEIPAFGPIWRSQGALHETWGRELFYAHERFYVHRKGVPYYGNGLTSPPWKQDILNAHGV